MGWAVLCSVSAYQAIQLLSIDRRQSARGQNRPALLEEVAGRDKGRALVGCGLVIGIRVWVRVRRSGWCWVGRVCARHGESGAPLDGAAWRRRGARVRKLRGAAQARKRVAIEGFTTQVSARLRLGELAHQTSCSLMAGLVIA